MFFLCDYVKCLMVLEMVQKVILKTPISEEDVRKLKVGDTFYISGTLITARDEAHKELLELYKEGKKPPIDLNGQVIYHCGPVVKKENDTWKVIAAGPTTSTRMEMFEDQFIEAFKVRVIIGKGGMKERTTKACQKVGAIYGAFTGGAALIAANSIKNVKEVYFLEELGMPEALWVFEVDNFGPLIVGIDSYGNNIFEDVSKKVQKNLPLVYKKVGIEDE